MGQLVDMDWQNSFLHINDGFVIATITKPFVPINIVNIVLSRDTLNE